MSNTSLGGIFDSHKEMLSQALQSFSLPRDTKKVEKTVAVFLNGLFENDGPYRQGLTQSEDYILQSAVQLLKAQQSITAEIVSASSECNIAPKVVPSNSINPYAPVIGTGAGSALGGLLGTWGAVCGAIAGTAIAVYVFTKSTHAHESTELSHIRAINVDAFINIVEKICESIDNIMETYRVQIKRLQNSYEQKEDINILSTHASMFEKVADLISEVTDAPNTSEGARGAAKMLINSFANYGFKYENGRIVNIK